MPPGRGGDARLHSGESGQELGGVVLVEHELSSSLTGARDGWVNFSI
jgi:hypothetical protein